MLWYKDFHLATLRWIRKITYKTWYVIQNYVIYLNDKCIGNESTLRFWGQKAKIVDSSLFYRQSGLLKWRFCEYHFEFLNELIGCYNGMSHVCFILCTKWIFAVLRWIICYELIRFPLWTITGSCLMQRVLLKICNWKKFEMKIDRNLWAAYIIQRGRINIFDLFSITQ